MIDGYGTHYFFTESVLTPQNVYCAMLKEYHDESLEFLITKYISNYLIIHQPDIV